MEKPFCLISSMNFNPSSFVVNDPPIPLYHVSLGDTFQETISLYFPNQMMNQCGLPDAGFTQNNKLSLDNRCYL